MNKKSSLFKIARKVAMRLNASFESIRTDDGMDLQVDGEIVVGAAVYTLDESGDYIPVPDGSYMQDGVTYIISGGAIAEIVTNTEMSDAEELEEPDTVSGDVTAEEVNEVVEILSDAIEVIKEQDDEIEALEDRIEILEEEFRKATGRTVGKSAGQTKFATAPKVKSFRSEQIANLEKNFRKIKK